MIVPVCEAGVSFWSSRLEVYTRLRDVVMVPLKLVLTMTLATLLAGRAMSLEYKEVFVTSMIDHFNPYIRSPSTFKQRMLVSDKYFSSDSGPILVYTGNEGPIDSFWNNTGFVMELAKKFHAYVVFIEHRYYGKSLPFGSDWQQDYNYQYLTVEQALADYAVILTDLKLQLGRPERKVIAFGGSYGGMLTAYMRFKYPNIVDGGLAASAPIYPMKKYDFFRGVTEDCHKFNPKCPVRIRSAFAEILRLAANGSTAGYQKLTSIFQLCDELSLSNQQHFLLWIRDAFTTMAMVDYPYAANFLGKLPAYPIGAACKAVLSTEDAISGLAAAVYFFYNATAGPVQCLDPAKEYIECADATGCGSMSQWDIQVCLQMRMPSGTNNVTDMFPPFEPWTNDDYRGYCSKKYGPNLSYNTDFFSVDLWSDRIRGASNLIFSNGDLDPWHYGGVLHDIKGAPSIHPILIKGGAHHLDLRASNIHDPDSVRDARLKEYLIIKSWLK